jgi:dolichyl-phosphate-mannose-protein mannosyltransferase
MSDLQDESTTPTLRTERRIAIGMWVVLCVAFGLRAGLVCWKPERLAEDRDLYRGIAQRLADGDGFVHPELGHATAYRPPLYPLLLAAFFSLSGGVKLVAPVQIGLGIATVWLTWQIGRRLGLGSWSLVAAGFVAVNPLLVQATSLAMTETLCTFLLAASLLAWPSTATHGGVIRRLSFGVLLGMGALCRPTVWAFIVLGSVITVTIRFRGQPPREWPWRGWIITAVACGLTVAPWVIRNWLVFGRPIVTSTHGGYTLLLGNNDEAYREEVAKPFGTLWDSRAWQRSLESEMLQAGLARPDEVARDRWLAQRAKAWIVQHPREFREACWLRLRRFWNVSPSGADAEGLLRVVRGGIATFYFLELFAAAIGIWRLRRDEWSSWWPLVCLTVSFSLVHLVYWSNLRMRTPVEPCLSLLAAYGLRAVRSKVFRPS